MVNKITKEQAIRNKFFQSGVWANLRSSGYPCSKNREMRYFDMCMLLCMRIISNFKMILLRLLARISNRFAPIILKFWDQDTNNKAWREFLITKWTFLQRIASNSKCQWSLMNIAQFADTSILWMCALDAWGDSFKQNNQLSYKCCIKSPVCL